MVLRGTGRHTPMIGFLGKGYAFVLDIVPHSFFVMLLGLPDLNVIHVSTYSNW